MKVEAWCCDRCGRLVPDREAAPPKGWLTAEVSVIGKASFREILACSEKCLALAIRPTKGPHRTAEPLRTTDGHRCPECGVTYERPQHLGLHRKNKHGVPSARERKQ